MYARFNQEIQKQLSALAAGADKKLSTLFAASQSFRIHLSKATRVTLYRFVGAVMITHLSVDAAVAGDTTESQIGVVGGQTLNYTTIANDPRIPLAAPESTAEAAAVSFDVRAQLFLADWACRTVADSSGQSTSAITAMNFNRDGEDFTTSALAMLAYQGSCVDQSDQSLVEWTQRLADVNRMLATVAPNGQLVGTTINPGDQDLAHGRWGDLDPALKDLVVIPFLYPNLITPDARKHIMDTLSVVTGGFNSGSYSINLWDLKQIQYSTTVDVIIAPLLDYAASTDVTVDETENHIHMIESTRYLANQLLHHEQPWMNAYDNHANGLHDWWMTRLQSILKHDFQEYNAKPYSRYSLDAIQNLAEFADDADLRTAAQMVLEFSSAKFAVSSSFLRRNSPFRRRAEHDLDGFLDDGGLDEQMCRFMLYSGKLDILPTALYSSLLYRLAPRNCNGVVRQAIGAYRVPAMILDLAMNKDRSPYFQIFSGGTNDFHEALGGAEIYDNEGSYLIAAGGIPLNSGLEAHISPPWPFPDRNIESSSDGDVGLALPTVLMPNDPGLIRTDRKQMIRFDGFPDHKHKSHHLCVGHSVACGDNPSVPGALDLANSVCDGSLSPARPCARVEIELGAPDTWTVWFVQLAGTVSDLYVAIWSTTFPGWGGPVGFFEAVKGSDLVSGTGDHSNNSLAYFKEAVRHANPNGPAVSSRPGGEVDVQYVRSRDSIDTVTFQFGTPYTQYQVVDNYWSDWSSSPGYTQPRPNPDTGSWPFADGPVSAPNHDGLITISNKAYDNICTLDLRDVRNPQRSGCDATLIPVQQNPGLHEGDGMPGSNVDKCTTCGPGGKTPMPRHNLE